MIIHDGPSDNVRICRVSPLLALRRGAVRAAYTLRTTPPKGA